DVMAHLFIAESREYYEIETLWQEPKPKPPRPPKEPKPPKEKKLPKKTKETGKKTVRKSATRSPRKTTATPRSRKK
ncbi:MAG: RsfS/YbeB/iojap family protein, partial [Kiritimatiellaeota bacterium]|nr:RsfS/YbeB/iojap family protein [Kiritimatiellota bacterium]